MNSNPQTSKYSSLPEWTDDQKAGVLFAPFREKSLNPHSWDRKMNFWTDAVSECAQTNNILVWDLKTLPSYFERQGKYPKCLETVLGEMVKSRKLKSLTDFQRQSNSWTQWGLDTFVRRPLVWGLNRVLPSTTSQGEIFVVLEQVKNKCAEVLDHHYSLAQHPSIDNLLELAAFRSRCAHLVSSVDDFNLVLKQLELDAQIIITVDKEGTEIVKVAIKGENKVRPIQGFEINILRIQKVMKSLEQQIEALSAQCDRHTAEARKLVREEKKSLALHQLRKRKTVQRQIDKKSKCTTTLHEIMQRIEDSSSNEMIVKAYESGLSAIRQLTGDITLDKVDTVLDDLQQVLEDQEEVNQAISNVSVPGLEVSMDDLEVELNDLLAEGGERGDNREVTSPAQTDMEALLSRLAASNLDDLPSVPTSPPGQASKTNTPQKISEPAV